MSPQPSIGHYRVISKIGEGGMGAVYRATDTRLNREVAIKVLPDAFASDPDRMARFTREAQVLAALNHPNIAAIYGIEQNAIVMELVDGEELTGPVPLDTAIQYARQIAAGLEAAHEKGIVHRDLKPANIKVAGDGTVKLLDFGLAKAVEQNSASGAAAATLSPTLSMATQAGVILGTAAYMSPEQARGKPVDKRADIWAFGVVVYEMLTGGTLFGGGETVSDSLAAVITKEPDWNALPKETPVHVRALLQRCLRKDPKLRMRDIGEARLALDEPAPVEVAVAPKVAPARSPLPWLISTSVLMIAAAVFGFGWWRSAHPRPQPLMRFDVNLGLTSWLFGVTALSPDGTRIAYLSQTAAGQQILAIRRLDQATDLTLAAAARSPFFSPDGQWVGYFTGDVLKKIPAHGGMAVTLGDTGLGANASPQGGAWAPDGTIVVGARHFGLMIGSQDSGALSRLTEPKDHKEHLHIYPQFLPDGKSVLFTATLRGGSIEDSNIDVLSLSTRQWKTVLKGYAAQYLPSGHLAYISEGKIFAVAFDPRTLEVKGKPLPIIEDLAEGSRFDHSQNGTLVYPSSGRSAETAWPIVWMTSSGSTTPAVETAAYYHSPRLSPDGQLLAATVKVAKGYNLWVFSLQRKTSTQLTFDSNLSEEEIVWTPNGKHIVFATRDPPALWYIRSDGSGGAQKLADRMLRPLCFTPDGRRLIFNNGGLSALPLDVADAEHPKAGVPEDLVPTPFVHDGEVSPDGRWIAYAGVTEGREEIYVVPLRASGESGAGKWRVSSGGGKFPRWSRTARELFFRNHENQILVADYTTTPDSFSPGNPKVWSPARIRHTGVIADYDLAPDGKRVIAFAVSEAGSGEGESNQVTFLLNFFDELRRRVPVN